jgi:hypothetical protein
MASITRMTIAFNDQTRERLLSVAKELDISYARLIGCLIELPIEKIKEAVDENYDTLFATAQERRAKDRELLSLVKGMTAEELRKL